MSDIVKSNGSNLPTTAQHTDPFAAYAMSEGSSHIIGRMLKFAKLSDETYWWFTQDQDGNKTEIPIGTEMVAHVAEMLIGYVRWSDNKPAEHAMGKLADGFVMPDRSTLGYHNEDEWEIGPSGNKQDPWQRTAYLLLMDREGNLYTFTPSSNGGRQATRSLSDIYATKRRDDPDACPIVKLSGSRYQGKKKQFGWIWKPIFTVIGWTDRAPIDEAVADLPSHDEGEAQGDLIEQAREEPRQIPKVEPKAATPIKAAAKRTDSSALNATASRKPRF